jgi:hypothetical protein
VNDRAGHTKNVSNKAIRCGAMKKQKIPFHCLAWYAPTIIEFLSSQYIAILATDRLKPDIKSESKLLSQFNDTKATRSRWPIMYPADYPIAFLWIMAVLYEIARSVFKLDPNTFLA